MRPGRDRTTRYRRRAAVLAALATGWAGLAIPLGQSASAAVANAAYTCNNGGAAADWRATLDTDIPEVLNVGQTIDISLVDSKFEMPGNETSWHIVSVRYNLSGLVTLPLQVAGSTLNYTTTLVDAPVKSSGWSPFNVSGSKPWTAPAIPGDYPLTMSGFTWAATKGNWSRNYNCSGSAAVVDTVRVMSDSNLTSTLPASKTVYRGDELTTTATIGVTGGTVAGTASVKVGTEAPVTTQVVNGKATLPVSTDLAPGSYPVKVEFLPSQSNFYRTSSRTTELVVLPAEATTTAISVRTPAFVDEPTALTATVVGPAGAQAGAPVGSVDFSVDGAVIGNVPLAPNGQATYEVPAGLSIGAHPVVATFKPANSSHFATSSNNGTIVINPAAAATTTALSLDAAELQTGVRPNATARVVATAGLAKGHVEFRVNGELVAQEPLDASGEANVDLPLQQVGTHAVTARYVSNDVLLFKHSSSAPVMLDVVPPAKETTTTISTERAVSKPSETTKVTVRTQGGSGTLTGDIVLQAAGQEYTKTVNTAGEAEFILPALAEGEYPMTARYVSANTNRWLHSRAEATLTVALPIATTTALTITDDRILAQQALPVSVQVHTGSGTPQGVVEISVDGQHDVSSPLPSDGLVRTTISGMSPGTHTIVATFVAAADGSHSGSASSARSVTVLDQAKLTLDSPPAVADDASASVSAVVSQIVGTPDGQVTFAVNGKTYDGTLSNGRYRAQLDLLAAGTYSVTASYVSANGQITAAATPVTLVVTPTPGNSTNPQTPTTTPQKTTLKASLSAAKVGYGSAPTVTVRVSPAASGWVRVNVAGREVNLRLANGAASAKLPIVSVGARPVAATFVPADATAFQGSRATVTLTVVKAATTLRVTAKSAAKRTLTVTTNLRAANAQRFSGKVTVTLKTKNKLVKKKTVKKTVVVAGNGVNQVTLKRLGRGKWTVQVSYSGSAQAGAAKAAKKAKVK